MNDERNDYEVGYKSPPIATRFKKGQSDNPSGKPKKISQELGPPEKFCKQSTMKKWS